VADSPLELVVKSGCPSTYSAACPSVIDKANAVGILKHTMVTIVSMRAVVFKKDMVRMYDINKSNAHILT